MTFEEEEVVEEMDFCALARAPKETLEIASWAGSWAGWVSEGGRYSECSGDPRIPPRRLLPLRHCCQIYCRPRPRPLTRPARSRSPRRERDCRLYRRSPPAEA